jgi:hypothetical protein
MKSNGFIPAEEIWDAILSRETSRILSTWRALNQEEQNSVLSHLERMVSEDGWHPEQVISAQCALDAIQSPADDNRETAQ